MRQSSFRIVQLIVKGFGGDLIHALTSKACHRTLGVRYNHCTSLTVGRARASASERMWPGMTGPENATAAATVVGRCQYLIFGYVSMGECSGGLSVRYVVLRRPLSTGNVEHRASISNRDGVGKKEDRSSPMRECEWMAGDGDKEKGNLMVSTHRRRSLSLCISIADNKNR
jgi:hypothetical protein